MLKSEELERPVGNQWFQFTWRQVRNARIQQFLFVFLSVSVTVHERTLPPEPRVEPAVVGHICAEKVPLQQCLSFNFVYLESGIYCLIFVET